MSLSRNGRGRTANPRIYVGCLPCNKGRWVADLEHANRWLENHWERCSRPRGLSTLQSARKASGSTPADMGEGLR